MNQWTKNLPVVALRGTVVLPGVMAHFDVRRKKSVRAVEAAMGRDQEIFLVTQRNAQTEDPSAAELYGIGTVAEIRQVIRLPKNTLRVLADVRERAELIALEAEQPYLEARIAGFEEEEEKFPPAVEEAMADTLRGLFGAYCRESRKIPEEQASRILSEKNLVRLIEQTAENLAVDYTKKQRILEADTLSERFETLAAVMGNEVEALKLRRELQEKVKAQIDKNQKEYILREQMKLIREELGEDDPVSDADLFLEQTDALEASDEVKERIRREIRRLRHLAQNNAEGSVARGYIETLLKLPWEKASRDNRDPGRARKILEEDHYGLEKVKERILEFLAVRSLTRKGESPILCLVGPPGTGKTSIARSIARALDKKYVRISLGGVRDEAEIRGHRRTYVGAMPGRIAAGLITAGVKNPLILLDEIDKVSSDYKGDTASALLEVLDADQNCRFVDHYVEQPIDLSEVLFLATANDPAAIPRPLLDRMEVIEISSYTANEKFHIAMDHLLPKQIDANGLLENQLAISEDAMRGMISGHTREAGVRNLERQIGRICRKAARRILEDQAETVAVGAGDLADFLGRSRYHVQKVNDRDETGIVRGLAWTSVGGDTLQIEVNVMPGKGEFLLTGQLGDVMKESAQAGISYIRSVADGYGVDADFFGTHDLHIHIPEGAVPKDGPSAGITMATAMLSAITKRPVRADLAMTGEITLRGRVLPVGGLKEKLLAAGTAGITKVLVPAKNRPDVEELDAEITDGLCVVYVETMEDVLREALV